jgi:hypothetical protein
MKWSSFASYQNPHGYHPYSLKRLISGLREDFVQLHIDTHRHMKRDMGYSKRKVSFCCVLHLFGLMLERFINLFLVARLPFCQDRRDYDCVTHGNDQRHEQDEHATLCQYPWSSHGVIPVDCA